MYTTGREIDIYAR